VRAFRKADREILALDRLTSTGVGIDPEKMRRHLDAIEERVQAGVRYHRMLQVDDAHHCAAGGGLDGGTSGRPPQGGPLLLTLCELVINDPQEAFIGQFVTMWRAVEADTGTHAMSLRDKDLASFQRG
jgi:hypothetical protein